MFVTAVGRSVRRLRRYLRRRAQPFPAPIARPGWWSALRSYADWKRSLRQGSPLEDRRPWVAYGAIDFLRRIVRPGMRAFEWGGGGSTVFLLDRGVTLTSIEHDADWFARLQERLSESGLSSDVRLVPPDAACAERADPGDPNNYFSTDPRHVAQSFRDYVGAIDSVPDSSLDLVLVDGRARPACVRHARAKVRPGGWLMLDNADRAHYQRAIAALLADWPRRDFAGPAPYVEHFVCTSVWRKGVR